MKFRAHLIAQVLAHNLPRLIKMIQLPLLTPHLQTIALIQNLSDSQPIPLINHHPRTLLHPQGQIVATLIQAQRNHQGRPMKRRLALRRILISVLLITSSRRQPRERAFPCPKKPSPCPFKVRRRLNCVINVDVRKRKLKRGGSRFCKA